MAIQHRTRQLEPSLSLTFLHDHLLPPPLRPRPDSALALPPPRLPPALRLSRSSPISDPTPSLSPSSPSLPPPRKSSLLQSPAIASTSSKSSLRSRLASRQPPRPHQHSSPLPARALARSGTATAFSEGSRPPALRLPPGTRPAGSSPSRRAKVQLTSTPSMLLEEHLSSRRTSLRRSRTRGSSRPLASPSQPLRG